jgi:hypothetical protein
VVTTHGFGLGSFRLGGDDDKGSLLGNVLGRCTGTSLGEDEGSVLRSVPGAANGLSLGGNEGFRRGISSLGLPLATNSGKSRAFHLVTTKGHCLACDSAFRRGSRPLPQYFTLGEDEGSLLQLQDTRHLQSVAYSRRVFSVNSSSFFYHSFQKSFLILVLSDTL